MLETKPEDSVKFFVGLASAAIGLVIVFIEKREGDFSKWPFIVLLFGVIALIYFVLCLWFAVVFYHLTIDPRRGGLDADGQRKREEIALSDARRCGASCLAGVTMLALAGIGLLFASAGRHGPWVIATAAVVVVLTGRQLLNV
jgi:hypothetical protein